MFMHNLKRILPGALICTLTCGLLYADTPRQLAQVVNGVGGASTNTVTLGGISYRHVGAGAQPGGIFSAASGSTVHHAGFLQAADIKRPGLDTDGDGTPDELDLDNDADGLSDLSEVSGSAFDEFSTSDPNLVDTDDDGMSDAEEATGLYDPRDPGHNLRIIGFAEDAGMRRIWWIGKGGGTINEIWSSRHLSSEPFTNIVLSAPFVGGVAPWYKTTNTAAFSESESAAVFQVRTVRPLP